jgi:PAS domain S-box-containing protein
MEAENRHLKELLDESRRELERVRRKLETVTVSHHRLLAEKSEIEERFHYLARNIREVFWIRTRDEVIFISPSYEKIWQRSCQSLLDDPNSYLKGIHPDDRPRIAEATRRKYRRNDLLDEEYRVVRPDGSTRWVWARSFPGERRGDKLIDLCIAIDITKRKHAENEVRKTRDQLEIRVAERTAELEQTNRRLKKNIQEQVLLQNRLIWSERMAAIGQLAASVAHEINSPLQGIASILNSLRSEYKEDKRLLEKLGWVDDGNRKICDTVRNLLDLNRPAQKRKAPLNVNDVIKSTVDLVKIHLKKKKISLHTALEPQSPSILASSQQLSQVFLNLINNAVEAMIGSVAGEKGGEGGFDGGAITISTSFNSGNLVIKFSDSGPGIPEYDLERIFDPFYTSKKTMGMGIGLFICHGIIEDHHGTITAKNLATRGAMFKIRLPAQPRPSNQFG